MSKGTVVLGNRGSSAWLGQRGFLQRPVKTIRPSLERHVGIRTETALKAK